MEERGWQFGKTLAECMFHMLNEQVDCDVKFIFRSESNTTAIAAHKYMLKARSPVFEAMFSGGFAETTKDVEITDSDPEIFREMLRFLYTEEAAITGDSVLQLLMLAKKYMIQGLTRQCSEYLESKLDSNNIHTILNQSVLYEDEILIQKCVAFVDNIGHTFFQPEAIYFLSREALLAVLKSDNLAMISEVEIYNACVNWAKKQCEGPAEDIRGENIRHILGDCLYQIRFSGIPPADFANEIGKVSDVLSEKEKNYIYCSMLTGVQSDKTALLDLGFNDVARRTLSRMKLFQTESEDAWKYAGHTECLQFTINKSSKLVGIQLYPFRANPGVDKTVDIKLFDVQNNQKLLVSYNKEVCPQDDNRTQWVALEKPVDIKMNQSYMLMVKIAGVPTRFGCGFSGYVVNDNITLSCGEGNWGYGNIAAAVQNQQYFYISNTQVGQIAELVFVAEKK